MSLLRLERLRTVGSRIAFVVFVCGLLAMIIALIGYTEEQGLASIEIVFERVLFEGYNWSYWWARWGRLGAGTAIIGYVCAYHYDRTLGRLLGWIRTGNA